jgi:tetratricopeptide (TPR) repeat protein
MVSVTHVGQKVQSYGGRLYLYYLGAGVAPLILALLTFLSLALYRAPAYVIALVAGGYALGTVPIVGMRLWRSRRAIGSPAARPHSVGNLGARAAWVPPSPEPSIGRSRELLLVAGYLKRHGCHRPRAVIITGPPGAGKTSLAAQAALRSSRTHPDGQVFVQYDDRLESTEAAGRKVLRDLIENLQTTPQELPSSLDGLAEAFGSATANLRLVIIADGIRQPELAQAILRAGPKCLIFFTSEKLSLRSGQAYEVKLPALAVSDALALLETRVGAERIAGEKIDAEKIVKAAELNPLAIALIGSFIAEGPYWSLALAYDHLAQRMQSQRSQTAGATNSIGLETALEISYERLTEDERTALSLLALLDTPIFPAWKLTTLLDTQPSVASNIIEGLLRAGLVERVSYDATGVQLFRAQQQILNYAQRKLTQNTDQRYREERRAKLSTAQRERARADLSRSTVGAILLTQEAGNFQEALAKARDAIALARDRQDRSSESLTLAALAEIQVELGYTGEADELAETSRQIGGQDSQPRALRVLGKVRRRWRHLEAAEKYLREGLQLAQSNSDTPEVTRILRELTAVQAEGADLEPALKTAEQAVESALGQPEKMPLLIAGCRWSKGRVLLRLGHLDEAESTLSQAYADAVTSGQRMWQAWIAHEQGRLELRLGQHRQAYEYAEKGLNLFATMQHRYGVAYCRKLLGEIFSEDRRPDDASRALDEALDTFQNCGDPWIEAETARIVALVRASQDKSLDAVRLLDNAATTFAVLDDFPSLGKVERERAARMRRYALDELNAMQTRVGVRRPAPR